MSCSLVDKGLVIQSALYLIIVGTGLTTVISASLSKNNFGGLCIFYGHVRCNNSDSDGTNNSNSNMTTTSMSVTTVNMLKKILVSDGQLSVCQFIITINVLVCFLYGLFNVFYHAYSAKKSAFQIRVGYQMWTKTLAFGSSLSLVLVMTSACMITVGVSNWCASINDVFKECQIENQKECSHSQQSHNKWIWSTRNGDETIVADHYIDLYEIAEVSCWINVALWLIQLAIYVHRIFRQRYVQTSYQEPFTVDFLDAFT